MVVGRPRHARVGLAELHHQLAFYLGCPPTLRFCPDVKFLRQLVRFRQRKRWVERHFVGRLALLRFIERQLGNVSTLIFKPDRAEGRIADRL